MRLVDDARWTFDTEKKERADSELKRLKKMIIAPGSAQAEQLKTNEHVTLRQNSSVLDILKQPGVTYKDLEKADLGGDLQNAFEQERVETEVMQGTSVVNKKMS